MDLAEQEYEDIARQIAQRIMGSADGRLPYDWKIGEGSSKLNGTPMYLPKTNCSRCRIKASI